MLAVYLLLIATARKKRSAHIAQLSITSDDPWQTAWYVAFLEFPFMWEAATSFGFFSTFAVPSISSVLDASKGFAFCPQLRYDDTAILMHEIGEHGPRSKRGAAALARTRQIHSKYKIKRDDMAFTLWVFCFEPVRWANRYEWRSVTPAERSALWGFWREVGVALGISDLPSSDVEFEQWGIHYEQRAFRYCAAARRLTDQVVDAAAQWGPGPTALKRRLLLWSVCALCPTPSLIVSLGLQVEASQTPKWFRLALRAGLLARSCIVGTLFPPRPSWLPGTMLQREVRHAAGSKEAAFGCPHGALSYRERGQYRISELGPPDNLPSPTSSD